MDGLYQCVSRSLLLSSVIYISSGFAYQNVIWTSDNITPVVTIAPFAKNSFESVVTINPVTGSPLMQLVAVDCTTPESNYKSVTQWLMYPYEGTIPTPAGNMKWMLTDMIGGGESVLYKATELSGPAGYGLLAYGRTEKSDSHKGCFNVGDFVNVLIGTSSISTATLKIDPQYAAPGHYNITIPLYFAVEENKLPYQGAQSGLLWRSIGKYMSSGNISATVPFDLVSSCNFNTSAITLSHGDISLTPDRNQLYRSNSHSLTITCDKGSPFLKIKLTGVESVSGKTANYIPCGKGGTCQLGFDVGTRKDLWDETITVINSETIVLHSDYQPNTTPATGPFSSNAILKIEML